MNMDEKNTVERQDNIIQLCATQVDLTLKYLHWGSDLKELHTIKAKKEKQ